MLPFCIQLPFATMGDTAQIETYPVCAESQHGMEQRLLKIVTNSLNTNIYSYFETSGGQSSNLYLNVVQFFIASLN
jgi:hypothetical protein